MCFWTLKVLLWCISIVFCIPMRLVVAPFSPELFELFTYSNWQFFPFYLSILITGQFLDGKRLPTVYAFALVEHIRKFSETRLVRVRLYLAGEFPRFNTDNVQSCPRLFKMRSHICETERQLYFMKVTCFISFCFLARGVKNYICIILL